jgi:DNA-binding response OmpR family regulator
MSGDREKALEAGCDDYEPKPVEFTRLLEKIESLLHGRAAPAGGRAMPEARRTSTHVLIKPKRLERGSLTNSRGP